MAQTRTSSVKKRLGRAAASATDLAKGTAASATDLVKEAALNATDLAKEATVSATDLVKETLDKAGVTQVVTTVSDTVSEEFDKISGKKILDLVEEHLTLQARYNDILASKLEEALQRITALEAHQSEGDHA